MDTNITLQTKQMIDNLKAVCANKGLGNASSEYKIITEVFLYKFLNDKFLFEAKKADKSLAGLSSTEIEEKLSKMSDDDYELFLLNFEPNTAKLKKTHFISYLFNHKNEENFHTLFDEALKDIAAFNIDIFSIRTGGQSKMSLFNGISQHVIEVEEKDGFCSAIIDKIANCSFESVFEQKYDFFAQIFEYLIKDYNKDFGKYAEYYTPHSIASIIAKIMVPDGATNVTVYDPAAGSGTLVLALAHEIGEKNCTIYTQDISQKSNEFLRLNLILNNLVHSLPNIVHGDTLLNPFHKNRKGDGLATFDYIVSNPPFNVDFSDTRDTLAGENYKKRFWAGVPNIPNQDKDSMSVYLMFLQHIIYSLGDKAKAAIVVPTGFLTANKRTNKIAYTLREYLTERKMIRGVITMPSNIFATTTTSVSVLFIENSAPINNKVILIDASRLGKKYKDGSYQRTALSETDVTKILSTYKEQKVSNGFSASVSFEDISDSNFSFKAGEYFDVPMHENEYTFDEYKAILTSYRGNANVLFNFDAICADAVNTVFDYWFCQYEFPNIDKDNRPYKSSGGIMRFSPEVGVEIPDGWEVKKLSNVCDVLLGGTPDTSKSEYWNGTIPWLNSGEIAYFPISKSEKSITELGMKNSATSFAPKGSVLISITRYIRASILKIDACFNQSVVAVIPNSNFKTAFLFPFIVSKIPLYMSLRTGAQQPHINKGTVENTYIAIPPKNIMDEYIKTIEDVYKDILNATQEAAKNVKIDDFSMPSLMNGQATVE